MPLQTLAVDSPRMPAIFFTDPSDESDQKDDDRVRYANYSRAQCSPLRPHINNALSESRYAAVYSQRLSTLGDEMSRPSYLPLVNGYTANDGGQLVASALTDMPRVTAHMWNWWQVVEPQRYGYRDPDAHIFARVTNDASLTKDSSGRQRTFGKTSSVEENIGTARSYLRATLFHPEKLGFAPCKTSQSVTAWSSGSSDIPVGVVWTFHFVRETPNGGEVRRRFIANDMRVLPLASNALARTIGQALTVPVANKSAGPDINRSKAFNLHEVGPDFLRHCAKDMNHFAAFLRSVRSGQQHINSDNIVF